MRHSIVTGFCIVFLDHNDCAIPNAVRLCAAPTLAGAITIARDMANNPTLWDITPTPAGFIIENCRGYELHRWHRQATRAAA